MNTTNCIDGFRIEGGHLVLTEEQKEMALVSARCKLLSDPKVLDRLRELQAEAMVEMINQVKARHCFHDTPVRITL